MTDIPTNLTIAIMTSEVDRSKDHIEFPAFYALEIFLPTIVVHLQMYFEIFWKTFNCATLFYFLNICLIYLLNIYKDVCVTFWCYKGISFVLQRDVFQELNGTFKHENIQLSV